ncbi:hypothetical protein Pst134EA_031352 [Puccinia striiformis f. sp. tritici]|uniref:uncharacterized protein n=1 Tax=Puccinia striiformis f. sp. tritici TaxID=168172 RepID=UPI00200899A0|nr:uncharacterized protein Pst134EA_031352 [Puccinia striiformis f. sp. tritici]KAH9445332.1 hypothetical protein Pst134EA_031352 [Puccinia striiformis f. sp. tritici]KAH9464909.1 hypothetical protein Pst134EB_004412 [Puccinia striiformis f. sp. tritici]
MVTLTLTARNGNNTRFFPHSGYLGLSPVLVNGHVQTRTEEDLEPILASRLIVRLRNYHQQQSSSPALIWQTEQILWQAAKPDYEPLADFDADWKLIIPTNTNSLGSITYQTWRSWWQVETVIYHQPAGILGSRVIKSHPLYLINYREAEKFYNSSIKNHHSRTIIQSSNPRIRYSINSPSSACCGDTIELKIIIGTKSVNTQQQQTESDLILKRLQVSLVRRLEIDTLPTTQVQTPIESDHHKPWRLAINPFSSSSSTNNNNSSSNSTTNLINNNPTIKRQFTTVNTLITNTEAISKPIALLNNPTNDSDTTTSNDLQFTVNLKIPIVKSKSHYSIGESIKINSVKVQYFFQFKLTIKNKLNNRLEILDLNELNLVVYSVTRLEIQNALNQLKKFSHSQSNPQGRTQPTTIRPPLISSGSGGTRSISDPNLISPISPLHHHHHPSLSQSQSSSTPPPQPSSSSQPPPPDRQPPLLPPSQFYNLLPVQQPHHQNQNFNRLHHHSHPSISSTSVSESIDSGPDSFDHLVNHLDLSQISLPNFDAHPFL